VTAGRATGQRAAATAQATEGAVATEAPAQPTPLKQDDDEDVKPPITSETAPAAAELEPEPAVAAS
jgi:hypothetical protein